MQLSPLKAGALCEIWASSPMTLGVELELQLVDAKSMQLRSACQEIFDLVGPSEVIVPELFQSMVEIKTGICMNAGQASTELRHTLRRLQRAAATRGLAIASAGTHAFARSREARIHPSERHRVLEERHRGLLPRLLVFGMHIHIGMRDGEQAVAVSNGILRWVPHLLALSASSPFLEGADTGFASCRATVFESIPTAGHPCTFSHWEQFVGFLRAAQSSGSMSSLKDLWWDVRPRPDFGTIEVRICDAPSTLREATAIAALTHCLCHALDQQRREVSRLEPPPFSMARENKWRALRDGLDAEFLVDERGRREGARAQIERLIVAMEPFAKQLSCEDELGHISSILECGSSTARQRAVLRRYQSFPRITEWLVAQLCG